MITMSYVMDFEILVLNNYKRRALSQVLELRGNDGHWETDLEYYRTVTFIFMTMHYDRNAPNRQSSHCQNYPQYEIVQIPLPNLHSRIYLSLALLSAEYRE